MLNRRSILKLIGIAPVAAPVIAAAGMDASGIGSAWLTSPSSPFVVRHLEEKPLLYTVAYLDEDGTWGTKVYSSVEEYRTEQARRLIDDAAMSANNARRTLGLAPLPAVLPYHAELMVG